MCGDGKESFRSGNEHEPSPTYQELVDFARWTQTFWKNGIEIMRKNNLVIKTDEPMEKLAFLDCPEGTGICCWRDFPKKNVRYRCSTERAQEKCPRGFR